MSLPYRQPKNSRLAYALSVIDVLLRLITLSYRTIRFHKTSLKRSRSIGKRSAICRNNRAFRGTVRMIRPARGLYFRCNYLTIKTKALTSNTCKGFCFIMIPVTKLNNQVTTATFITVCSLTQLPRLSAKNSVTSSIRTTRMEARVSLLPQQSCYCSNNVYQRPEKNYAKRRI